MSSLAVATKNTRENIGMDGKRTILLMNKYNTPTITSAFRVFYLQGHLHVSTAEGCYTADEDIMTSENIVLLNKDDLLEEEGEEEDNSEGDAGSSDDGSDDYKGNNTPDEPDEEQGTTQDVLVSLDNSSTGLRTPARTSTSGSTRRLRRALTS